MPPLLAKTPHMEKPAVSIGRVKKPSVVKYVASVDTAFRLKIYTDLFSCTSWPWPLTSDFQDSWLNISMWSVVMWTSSSGGSISQSCAGSWNVASSNIRWSKSLAAGGCDELTVIRQVLWWQTIQCIVYQNGHLKLNALPYWYPLVSKAKAKAKDSTFKAKAKDFRCVLKDSSRPYTKAKDNNTGIQWSCWRDVLGSACVCVCTSVISVVVFQFQLKFWITSFFSYY